MSQVQVIQRHAHLAGGVRLEFVNGREGKVAKAMLTAISNTRRGSGESREEEATAIQWTLWGKQAENAAEYLGKGSHVNIVGRLRNNNYEKDGQTVYGMAFTAEEIDYLDSKSDAQARRGRGEGDEAGSGAGSSDAGGSAGQAGSATSGRNPRPRAMRQPVTAAN
ncbi:MAG: single-stranded DNA-binding protein [Burkholderiales bacterium]|nr:single-stranded DNA-binding protein [Burkholderiales bacterium]MDE1927923.1 single-stranded DNA-binding protein [Burkholderiales bacterium]MDE2157315.1 single-stranded DNA-binding protein [Burkholderiales bacterium]MDE2502376.1 single-stranded DNA-binding protein [Burkholderiales bacterium]